MASRKQSILPGLTSLIALVALNLEQFKLVRTMMVDSGYTGQNFVTAFAPFLDK